MRLRRLRRNEQIRNLIAETEINLDSLIYPLFVVEGTNIKREIESMPDVFHYSIDCMMEELDKLRSMGLFSVLLFGLPSEKDEKGRSAYCEDGIIQRALREGKKNFPDMLFITDVCLCEYTSHGHCGIVENGEVLNDPTVELLAKIALSHAQAGADIVAPSDMMDNRVGAIRAGLDHNGFADIAVMSYSAKYASSFYGPFRAAADCAPSFGDRRSYQMDYRNAKEAIREVEADIDEGADIVMIKPALAYLDIIKQVSSRFSVPVAAYNVSGEYGMIKAAAAKGWIDEHSAVNESLTAIKRAGASIIITYFAKQVALAKK